MYTSTEREKIRKKPNFSIFNCIQYSIYVRLRQGLLPIYFLILWRLATHAVNVGRIHRFFFLRLNVRKETAGH
jgi:hypothetical protein